MQNHLPKRTEQMSHNSTQLNSKCIYLAITSTKHISYCPLYHCVEWPGRHPLRQTICRYHGCHPVSNIITIIRLYNFVVIVHDTTKPNIYTLIEIDNKSLKKNDMVMVWYKL